MTPLLSILIPSLVSRKGQLTNLLTELNKQHPMTAHDCDFQDSSLWFYTYNSNEIEVIVATDNKQITTGAKRNKLLQRATGKYVCFIDDDDKIYKGYISSILEGCNQGKDCLAISGLMTTDNKNPVRWHISKDYKDENLRRGSRWLYLRHTNHLSPVLRSIAIQIGFPDKSNAEDSWYSSHLKDSGLLKTEAVVKGMVYLYDFKTGPKEYK